MKTLQVVPYRGLTVVAFIYEGSIQLHFANIWDMKRKFTLLDAEDLTPIPLHQSFLSKEEPKVGPMMSITGLKKEEDSTYLPSRGAAQLVFSRFPEGKTFLLEIGEVGPAQIRLAEACVEHLYLKGSNIEVYEVATEVV